MEFKFESGEIVVVNEQHYKLVSPSEISDLEIANYKLASDQN